MSSFSTTLYYVIRRGTLSNFMIMRNDINILIFVGVRLSSYFMVIIEDCSAKKKHDYKCLLYVYDTT